MSQQIWAYIGWVLFTLFVFGIAVLTYALYRDYELTKNKKQSLPSLEVIESSEKKNVFVSEDPGAANGLTGTADKIPSRRALRGSKASSLPSPTVEAKPSAFFDDDDEEFTLTAGRD